MKNIFTRGRHIPLVLSSLFCSVLVACGGGANNENAGPISSPGKPGQPAPGPSPAPAPAPNPIPNPLPNPEPIPTNPVPAPNVPLGATLTTVSVHSFDGSAQTDVPVTFGQLFKEGTLKTTEGLVGKLTTGQTIALQLDVKATHDDGSVRHAVVSGLLPTLPASPVTIELAKISDPSKGTASTIENLLNAGFKASTEVTISGTTYTARAEEALLLESKSWIAGDIATEWLFSAPLKDSAGNTHPHLHVQYAVRYYDDAQKARVDFTVENTWAFEPNPQNYQYDVVLKIADKEVYRKAGLTHYHHARWRKLAWWGQEPSVHVAHDGRYLIDTKALPNYDPKVVISTQALAGLKNSYTGAKTEPMASGLAVPYMPTTGGRPDIGLQPGWAVSYLLSMDKYAKVATLGTADLSGSWSHHYRDKKTGRPIDLFDYPYMTILGRRGDTYNPVTKQYESFPACGGTCSNPNDVDTSHAPNFAYLPYIVTGDYYYLEELQFTAMYDSFSSNPGYRKNIKGLVHPDQVRGQAWSLRIIGEAGYITPDNDPMKSHFKEIVQNNIDWYDENYTNNSGDSAKLGALTHGYAVVYNDKRGLAPWQDDFFTSSIGHLVDLGYVKAKPLLAWKAKFPVARMTAPGMCWISGAAYSMNIKDTVGNFYGSWLDIYNATVDPAVASTPCASSEMAKVLGVKQGEMTGYAYSNSGYPSNMQPALAYSVDAGIPNAVKAWEIFMARTTLPDYQNGAQFGIVPRR